MTSIPIGELITVKRRPETTLELSQALARPEDTVRDYVFTDAIRQHIDRIFDSVSERGGQGFWVQAQYGGGKTHFLAVLALLLSGRRDLWDLVSDEEIASRYPSVSRVKLLPVVFSLRGQAAVPGTQRTLYQVLEQKIQEASARFAGQEVQFSTADEIEAWWSDIDPTLRTAFETRLCDRLGVEPEAYRRNEGADAFASAIVAVADELRVQIPVTASTRERLLKAYRLIGERTDFDGILVVIDEFAFWQELHPEGTTGFAEDEELLETLAWTLPKAEGAEIYTVIASQKPVPSKFRASEREGRFITLEILRRARGPEVQRDYEQIVSARVRELRHERLPEIDEYLHYYRDNYQFARDISEDWFRTAFPVQDRAFEILRLLTHRLQSTRVGINVLWDLLADGARYQEGDLVAPTNPRLLKLNRLLVAADLLESLSLQEALEDVQFRYAYTSYQNAVETIARMSELDDDEKELAKRVVATLFLWYLANLDQPVPLSASELAEAVLAEAGLFPEPKQSVISVIEPLRGTWVRWEPVGELVSFEPQAAAGRPPQQVLEEYLARPPDPHQLSQRWQEELTNADLFADNMMAPFGGLRPMELVDTDCSYGQIAYKGQQTVAPTWVATLGAEIQDPTRHFRVVYLLAPTELTADALDDDRIAVVVPADRSEAADTALRHYLAVIKMEDDYRFRQDPEATHIRGFIENRRQDFIRTLIQQQRRTYEQGRIITRANIQIDPREVFQAGQPSQRTQLIVEKTLSHAYRDRPTASIRRNLVFGPPNAGHVFEGFFKQQAAGRSRDAVKNFGAALGLSTAESPNAFNPEHSEVFEFIRDRFDRAREAGEMLSTWELYRDLARRGIPAYLTTLYLLCFVRRPQERADAVLRSGHRIRFENGTSPGERLTAAQIQQVEWKPAWANGEAFDALVETGRIPWEDVIDWLRQVSAKLKAVADPDEVEDEERLLVNELRGIAGGATNALQQLQDLQAPLGQVLPEAVVESLERAASYGDVAGYEELYRQASDGFETADEFGQHLSEVRAWHELAQKAGAVGRAYTYLTAVPGGPLGKELEVERQAILARVELDDLLAQPSKWNGLEQDFTQWKSRYRTAYQKFHRDYLGAVASIEGQADEISGELGALGTLDEVPQLGERRLADTLRGRWTSIQSSLRHCQVRDPSTLDVDNLPVCSECRIELGTVVPDREVEDLRRQLRNALDAKLGSLQASAIRQLLEESGDRMASALAQAVTISDRAKVIELLNIDGAAELLRRLLQKVTVVDVGVMARLREEFPTVSRENLPEVLRRFQALLEEALAEAERKGPPGTHLEVRL